jgi:outer membrane receptor protein involved in Fe transport
VAADARAVEGERDLFIDHEVWDLLGFYAQDDIRVNNEFTLNLGLRYDLYTVPLSVANTQSNFVDSGPNAGLIQLASSNNRAPNVNNFTKGFEPRIAVASSPDSGKTRRASSRSTSPQTVAR